MPDIFPKAGDGQTVGLLGGSFDPPHLGHVHITKQALKRFGLDRVWWLVSPGNPLKTQGPQPLKKRMAACRAIMDHPRVSITDIETKLGTRYTSETLAELQIRFPHIRFVWLMGADNLAELHHWQNWQEIMTSVPVGVLARPGDQISARRSVAARRFEKARLKGQYSQFLAKAEAPCWCYINVPLSQSSSTELRANGTWTS